MRSEGKKQEKCHVSTISLAVKFHLSKSRREILMYIKFPFYYLSTPGFRWHLWKVKLWMKGELWIWWRRERSRYLYMNGDDAIFGLDVIIWWLGCAGNICQIHCLTIFCMQMQLYLFIIMSSKGEGMLEIIGLFIALLLTK